MPSTRRHLLLTPRQSQVTRLLLDGLQSKQIAAQLKISERTVNTHIGDIYRKLKVHSRAELLLKAIDLGMLEADQAPPPFVTVDLDLMACPHCGKPLRLVKREPNGTPPSI